MRDRIGMALKDAKASGDKRRLATLRLVQTAIKDRDSAARDAGSDGVDDEDVLDILQKMVRQRDISASEFEEAGQLDLAEQEQREADIIREFLPEQINGEEMRRLCEATVKDIKAAGLRDIGRCMSELKARYPGQMDFVQASCVVKDLLRSEPRSEAKAGE
ncbi:GatB/YqeY domain-containing protein [Roseibium sp.]|uniref:GatB/YqeY domain-containing protein n=1 Tax=Roseibium sp. TaxID=1936156 RepID=UPI003A973465